jgi:hypothetical protein
MSTPDWQELERLWQSSAEAAEAKELMQRVQRRPWLPRFIIAFDIVGSIAVIVYSIALMFRDRPYAVATGAGLLVLTLIGGAITLWARRAPKVTAAESVTTVLDATIHRVQVRARLALGSLWVNTATLFFFGFMAFMWSQAGEYTTAEVHKRLTTVSLWCLQAGLLQVLLIPYYLRRVRELARLQEIRRGLMNGL